MSPDDSTARTACSSERPAGHPPGRPERIVMITRSPADCQELQALVRPAGIRIKAYPVLRLEPETDRRGWRRVLAAVPPAQGRPAGERTASTPGETWLVLTSPRAPAHLVCQAREREATHLLELPVAAVGPSTAAAAAGAGLRVQLEGSSGGAALAQDLVERLPAGSCLVLACGKDRRPELPRALEAAGHRVLPLVVYSMRPTPPREIPPLGPRIDVVVLTSPRAARLYLDSVGGLPLPCEHMALGATTRDAAAAIGVECSTPPEPTMASLAEELCQR
jgi:uroporphyrinogen-III synthase